MPELLTSLAPPPGLLNCEAQSDLTLHFLIQLSLFLSNDKVLPTSISPVQVHVCKAGPQIAQLEEVEGTCT